MNYRDKRNVLPPDAGYQIFGADAAEDDPNLSSYFVKTTTWQKVLNGRVLVVLGRKGSGKSAIFKMLSEEATAKMQVVLVTPKLFALDILNSFNTKYPDNPLNQEIAYAAAWRYSLMLELLLAIEDRTGCFKLGNESGVHNWLRKHVEFDADIVSRTIAFLESWKIEGISLADLSLAISKNNRRSPLIGQDIDQTVPDVERVLKETKYMIAIDNLDEGWVNIEDARTYLVGLVLAAKELSRLPNLNIVVFMRSDMYRALETTYQHMDKFRQSIEYIEWNPTSLSRMISLRIQKYFGINDESNELSWSRVFPKYMKNNFIVYKHIMERTFLRPREIIQFCRLIVDNAAKFKKNKADEKDIQNAEIKYSDWKLSDLSGEYSAYYKNIDKFLECFRRTDVNFSKQDLENCVRTAIETGGLIAVDGDRQKLSVENITTLLYQMGFLRAKYETPNGKWRYVSSSSEPYLICSTVETWDMHPAFRRKLIIRSSFQANNGNHSSSSSCI